MNTKKIWLFAMVFGVIAAVMMFVMIMENESVEQVSPPPVIEEEETVEEVEQVEEEKGDEMIPIAEGKRALTVAVTDVHGAAGFVVPGSYVDIVAVMEVPEEQKETQHDSATLLLQNVKVLAVGHAGDDKETMKHYQMITVEVTPKEGLVLGFSTRYELYVMLRQEGDDNLEPEDTHIHEDDLHEGVFK